MAERGPLSAAARSPLRPPAADWTPRPRRCGGCDPQPLSAAAAPTSLGKVPEPAARLEAAPAAVPLQPLPGEGAHADAARHALALRRPTRAPVAAIPQAAAGSLSRNSRENGSGRPRSASLDLTQYGTCPRGGGSREERAGPEDLARRGTRLGERRQELGSPGRLGWRPPRGARAPLCGRTGECLAPRRKAAVTASGKRAKRSLNSEPPAHWSRQFPRTTCKNRQALSRKLSRSRLLKDKWLTSGCW